jgi:hypothetical protein
MPYTKEQLGKKKVSELKKLYQLIQVHKSALSDKEMGDKNPFAEKTLKNTRERLAKEAKRMDLIFDVKEYNKQTTGLETSVKEKEKKQKDYLIDKIIKVQTSPFIGRYANLGYGQDFDYVTDIDNIKGTIDPITGNVRYLSLDEFNKKSKKESKKLKEESKKPAEPRDEDLDALISKEFEQFNKKPEETSMSERIEFEKQLEQFNKKPEETSISERVALRRKERFDEDLDDYNTEQEYINKINEYLSEKGDEEFFDRYDIIDVVNTQKRQLKLIRSMQQNLNYKDKTQTNVVKNLISEFIKGVEKQSSNDVYDKQESDVMIKGLEYLKRYDKTISKKEIDPIIQRIVDKRDYEAKPQIGTDYEGSKEMYVKPEQKPLEPFGGLQSEQEINAPYLSTQSDKDIGNVREVGFLGAMDQLAKVDDVTLEPSERSKSLKRFTNFRWVQSVQNSDLGYASPFQRMDDIDDRRRYGKCFMHGNKMPKDPETQEELNKAKGFNTYSLVPSFDMSSRMQPAGNLSFINSTSKFARKITGNEQGMEPINQGKRNVSNLKNTLEFPTLLYSEDPLKKIKDKYKNNIVC